MVTDSLRACIDNALAQAEFMDMFDHRFDVSVLRQLYEANQHCVFGSTDSITVRAPELHALTCELDALLGSYKSPSGFVGNGLYLLTGTSGSPRLPSVEDYAKGFVLAAARIGSERVLELFSGWLGGVPVRRRHCALLRGIETEGVLEPVEGMRLETLRPTSDDYDRTHRIDDYGIHHSPLAKQAMLSIEHETICPLYDPESFRESFPPDPLPATLVNPDLASLSLDEFCRAMSLEANRFVDWSMQWHDYGDAEAFFLQTSASPLRKESRSRSNTIVSAEHVRNCLHTHALLRELPTLDLPVARWQRSKRSPAIHEQLIELRIALESLLLHEDKRDGEKRHRLAVRGAWFLAETFEDRRTYFDALRQVYDTASVVIHGGRPKAKQGRDLESDISRVQDLCRDAIMRIGRAKEMPNWSDVILGRNDVEE